MTIQEKIKFALPGDTIVFQHFLDNHLCYHTIVNKTKENDKTIFWFYDRDGTLKKMEEYMIEDIKFRCLFF